MKKTDPAFALALAGALVACSPSFVPTTTPAGVPNLAELAPGSEAKNMWRMGQPPTAAAWNELEARVNPPDQSGMRKRVVVVKLNDEVEGSDEYAEEILHWSVFHLAIDPEEDKPWTVFEKPNPVTVKRAVKTIINAHEAGYVTIIHCVHGRDRTSLVSALVGMKLLGWTKKYAWADMIKHGYRWDLPDIDLYWAEDVK